MKFLAYSRPCYYHSLSSLVIIIAIIIVITAAAAKNILNTLQPKSPKSSQQQPSKPPQSGRYAPGCPCCLQSGVGNTIQAALTQPCLRDRDTDQPSPAGPEPSWVSC